IQLGYVQKINLATGTNKRAVAFKITDQGIQNMDQYNKVRREILIDFVRRKNIDDLFIDSVMSSLTKIKEIYNECSRITSFYKREE
ncbi:MAG: hypothetical protein AAGA27_02865, partial [Pseudomonadota bacterium]